ncbi:hypothetical protein ACFL06_01800 [Patescibacteria group bacterium]
MKGKENIIELTSLDFKRQGIHQDLLDDFLNMATNPNTDIIKYRTNAFIGISSSGEQEAIPYHIIKGVEKDNSYNTYVIIINSKKFDDYYKKLKKSCVFRKKTDKGVKIDGLIFSISPPQIIYGKKKISIPVGSKQYCVCKILFSREIGEVVSWDEIAEEIDGLEKRDLQSSWRTVYDAVIAVNKKVEKKIGKKIFITSRKSFHRIV